MVERIDGGFRIAVSKDRLDGVTRTDVSDLLEAVRRDPDFGRNLSKFEFSVVESGNGRYLQLKEQPAFGSFKDAAVWSSEERQVERDAALAVLAAALGDDDLVDGMFGRFADEAPQQASRSAVEIAALHLLPEEPSKPSPALPPNVDASQVTQYQGTNTCWALSTLIGCLELDGGRDFLDERFTKTGTDYRLQLKDGRAVTVTPADLSEIDKKRKANSAYRTDDVRPQWLRAFEAACTRIEKQYEAAAFDPALGMADGDYLADRIGLESDTLIPTEHSWDAVQAKLADARDGGRAVLVVMSGHCHVLEGIDGDAITLKSTLGGSEKLELGFADQVQLSREQRPGGPVWEAPKIDYRLAQMSKTVSSADAGKLWNEGKLDICLIDLPKQKA